MIAVGVPAKRTLEDALIFWVHALPHEPFVKFVVYLVWSDCAADKVADAEASSLQSVFFPYELSSGQSSRQTLKLLESQKPQRKSNERGIPELLTSKPVKKCLP